MAKRTPPAPPETEAKTKTTRRRAATAAVAKTTKAREAIAAPKSPPPSKPPRAESRARKQISEAEVRPAAPRRSRGAGPTPQAPPEPYRAAAEERAAGATPAHPLERRAAEFSDEPLDSLLEDTAADEIDPELRHRMISEAAYHHYIQRGYEDGYDLDDWLQAEAEIDQMLHHRAG